VNLKLEVMARQSGIIKLEGTIGDISFYKSKDGMLARAKGGVDGDRIRKDPAFAQTRENGSEFARAGSAGKLLRNVFRPWIRYAADGRMVSRLTKQMVAVIKADAASVRGQRNVLDGELELLRGFDFNKNAPFADTFRQEAEYCIDRAQGAAIFSTNGFNANANIMRPDGASHAQVVMISAEINFETGEYQATESRSAFLDLESQAVPGIVLSNGLPPQSEHPLFMVVGIEFFQEVNRQYYPLSNNNFNAMSILIVSGMA
jgi:hypothetical protein